MPVQTQTVELLERRQESRIRRVVRRLFAKPIRQVTRNRIISKSKSRIDAFETYDQAEEANCQHQEGEYDADPKLCGSYERIFAASGLHIETAVNGLDCWKKIRTSSPDALLVDVDLLWGGSDGVLARLREDCGCSVKPEVFVTGDESPEVLSRRAGIAVGRCFQKPLEIEIVLDSICDVFASDPEITYSGNWI